MNLYKLETFASWSPDSKTILIDCSSSYANPDYYEMYVTLFDGTSYVVYTLWIEIEANTAPYFASEAGIMDGN